MGMLDKINQMADAINAAKTEEQKQRLFALTKDYVMWWIKEQHSDPVIKERLRRQLKALLGSHGLKEVNGIIQKDQNCD